MSASREKKTRQGQTSQGPDERVQERQRKQKADRRSSILYAVVGVICVAAIAVTLVLNSGLIQRSMTAVTIQDTKYSAADLQYYYNVMYQNTLQYAMYGLQTGFDYTKDPKDQVYDQETGDTWYDHLLDGAVDYLTTITALYDKAVAEGYAISEDGQAALDETVTTLNNAWVGQYNTRNEMIRSNYGPYMTYDHLLELLEREALVSDYASTNKAAYTYSQADYESYYQENKDALDTFTTSQLALRASVNTTDENGDTIEMTEEEQAAALEEAKTQAQAVAQEVEARLQAGEDPQTLSDEYGEELYSTVISSTRVGSSVNSAYSEWVFDSARQNGDVTLVEYDSGSMYYYYVVRFEGRALDDSPSASVRHILVSQETDEGADEPTQEQLDAALAEAESLLAEWQAGEATEDSFAALAQSSSDDTGSATSGGLISNITSTSSYVDSFKEWALDASRQPGDTGIVESEYGYHIMYYVSSGDPTWKQTAASALREEDYTAWEEEATSGYEAVTEFGMNFVA